MLNFAMTEANGYCALSRRAFLRSGASGAIGLTLGDLLALCRAATRRRLPAP